MVEIKSPQAEDDGFVIIDDDEESDETKDVDLRYGKMLAKLRKAEKGDKPLPILKKIYKKVNQKINHMKRLTSPRRLKLLQIEIRAKLAEEFKLETFTKINFKLLNRQLGQMRMRLGKGLGSPQGGKSQKETLEEILRIRLLVNEYMKKVKGYFKKKKEEWKLH